MYKNVLQSIAGIEIYPLISFGIFFLFFLGLLVWVVIANRQHLHTMSLMPLLGDDETAAPHSEPDALC
ncbi:hypothetical protein FY528_16720 [Hymenobacter lutimineralis]|uniref:CcoQ/FixQ family Cbb3-type cytochrome c oxidase assembly chaperone n=1 Tax=Hymenobacter lutimineralis TaxID=2606448 RepID=A0A5D6UTN2_9BACT|nr:MULTISPECIES: hypothetical protein [Hymenobacter]QIX62302.1 hypothetical protein HER32_14395 [Hymenobacter sp. BT18]TYZ06916.1 hypothetical protein FY528_16720 [Hymenobacter lutimineralis]